MKTAGREIQAWIFARGGSRGLPGKNIRPLCGRPLLQYAVAVARASAYIREVFVSTDSEEIAAVARAAGAVVPFLRPAELAGDRTPERLAWRHAIEWNRSQTRYSRMEVMVSLPPTAPLRTVAEVDSCIEAFLRGGSDTVIAVSRSNRHPAFNMVTLDQEGYARLAMEQERGACRQSFSPVYNIATAVYVTDPDFVLAQDHYFDGRVRGVEIPEEDALDIDSALDFKIADMLMRERNHGTRC